MREKIQVLVVVWLCLSGYHCQRLNPCRDFPDLQTEPNQPDDDRLRLAGYYYEVVTDTPSDGNVATETIVLYQNGVATAGGSIIVNSLVELDNEVRSVDRADLYKEARDFWGIFTADSLEIELAHWMPKPCGKYGVKRRGRVLSDTSFVLTTQVGIGKSAPAPTILEPDISQTFYFRPFSPKPDSTNDFVP